MFLPGVALIVAGVAAGNAAGAALGPGFGFFAVAAVFVVNDLFGNNGDRADLGGRLVLLIDRALDVLDLDRAFSIQEFLRNLGDLARAGGRRRLLFLDGRIVFCGGGVATR